MVIMSWGETNFKNLNMLKQRCCCCYFLLQMHDGTFFIVRSLHNIR